MTVAEALSIVETGQRKGSLSGSEPTSADRIASVRDRLNRTTDVTDKELNKATTYSLSTLSQFRNNKYTGNNTEVAAAIEEYLNLREAQAAISAHEFVPTTISRRIERAIAVAETTRRIAVLAISAGCGKTATIRQYQLRQAGRARSVYISCSPDLSNIHLLMQELYFALTRTEHNKKSQLRRELVGILTGTNRTIFIDEAQHLTAEGAEMLRCIADQANVAMVLSGNESIYEHGSNGKRRSAAAHTQFASRVVQRVCLSSTHIAKSDVKVIAAQFLDAATVEDTLDMLVEETRGRGRQAGGFRRLVTILTLAQISAAPRPVRRAHIIRAIQDLEDDGGES
jgi:DNA transposition AAA+ family ATPase